jgi:hypothetical protein
MMINIFLLLAGGFSTSATSGFSDTMTPQFKWMSHYFATPAQQARILGAI